MSRRNESSRKHVRKPSRPAKKDAPNHFPAVTFDGAESVNIPADEGKSPVSTHISLASNPAEFKFMDEIALLKRGRIDKDAPKHPYNRRGGQHHQEDTLSKAPAASTRSHRSVSSAVMTLMAGTLEGEETYNLGKGQLKYWKMKEGGERYEVSTPDDLVTVYQQSEGQTCLFTFKL